MFTRPLYRTQLGAAYVGDSLLLLEELGPNSVDLVMTSPPFALLRQKDYGNKNQDDYVDWLLAFGQAVKRVLKSSGSFVVDLGGAYEKGLPVRSLYNYRFLVRMCDDLGFHLAEEFFWHNPAKLPSPIEWVNKRKIRAKDSVNTVWWFCKDPLPKADITKVLTPYSERMQKLLANSQKYYRAKKRPSGHDVSMSFDKDNGGAIPSNLLQIPNTESNSQYLRYCKAAEVKAHSARFPSELPRFFVKMLTEPGDLVVDIFAGSNTTGEVCENLERRWMSFELNHEFLSASSFRFVGDLSEQAARELYERLVVSSDQDIELCSNFTVVQLDDGRSVQPLEHATQLLLGDEQGFMACESPEIVVVAG